MIQIKQLSYKYKTAKEPVLKGVDFEVKSGEIVAVVGKNGSGKSTLGKLVTGILRPAKKAIYIDDLDVSEKKNHEGIFQKSAIVFQNPENQIIFSNVRDEIAFAMRGLTETDARINKALKLVDMAEYKDANLYDLSLGQKQRIILAEALVREPKYLILDEPTTMIDSEGKEKIHEIIRDLAKGGMGILLITNSAEELLLADRILFLANGKVGEIVRKTELLDKAEAFERHGIAKPLMVQIVAQLQAQGMNLKMKNWTVKELVRRLKDAK